jgi:membrane protease YdiL (CAAX protease family)
VNPLGSSPGEGSEAEPDAPAPVEIPIGSPRREPPWGVVDILIVALFALVSLMVLATVGLGLAPRLAAFHSLSREQIATGPLFLIPVQAVAYLATFLFARMLITLRAQDDFWKAVRWNALPAGDMTTFTFGGIVLALLTQVIGRFLPIPKDLPMDKYFTQPSDVYLMMAFGLLVAPLMEELFFRGLIFPVAARATGKVLGIAITAFLFALIHQGQLAHAWAPLLLLFFVGVVLTTIRAMTNSVAASWITHFSYNTTLFTILIYATGGLQHLERLNQ